MTNYENSFLSGLINYLFTDPIKVWSGSQSAYHKLYNEYIRVCRNEIHDASMGVFEKETLYRKQYLIKKIQKLRRVLTTSSYRNYKRNQSDYTKLKFNRFQSKISKF